MATLAIDRTHRYKAAAEIFRRLNLGPEEWVLDVGGGSGNLIQYLSSEKIFTLDPFGSGEFHIRASMDNIPLPDDSFDLVIQIDSLEHIPTNLRARALGEMARVARKFLIWIGPVDSELAIEAEEDLCASHRELFSGREMQWLSEHRVHGLPDENLLHEILAPQFFESCIWRSFPLGKWWTLMRLDQQLEAGMFQPELEREIDRWYEASGWKSDYFVPHGDPGYRTIFVGSKTGPLPEDLSNPPPGLQSLEEWKLALPLIEAAALSSPLDHEGKPQDPRIEWHLKSLRDQLPLHTSPHKPIPKKNSFWRRLFGA